MIVGAPLFCRRLVGRAREFATLHERYQEAIHRRGSLVIVTGEAGIGKTRFLLEVLQQLKAAGATCLRSQFFEHVSTPMGPLVEMFRELYKILPTANRQEHASARFGRAETSSSYSVIFDSRASQFASIAETLLRCAAAAPLVIAMEDIHWADPATLECLQYLASHVEGARLLFILTYRGASLDRRQTPAAEFSKLTRQANVWQLELGPLENTEMQALVNETVPADHELPGADRFRILELAEGNPLFAEELLKHGLELGVSRLLPPTISAVFLQRLESFSEEGRLLLSQAAVIGKRFDAQLLANVSNQSSEAILVVLRTARELQIIVEDAEVVGSYNFRHALVREALYEELMAVEACTLHRRIAEYLEKLPETEERTIELAYHWSAAREPAKAVRYNEAAAKVAEARFASEDACRYYDRALAFIPEGTLKQAELRVCQARQLRDSSQLYRAIDVLELAFEFFENLGLTDRVIEIALELANDTGHVGRSDYLRMWTARALEAIGDNKAHPKRARCCIMLGFYELTQGSIEQARAYVAAGEESLFAAPPDDRVRHFQLLIMFAEQSGDFASAVAAYRSFHSFLDKGECGTLRLENVWLSIAISFQRFGALEISKYAAERTRLASLAHPGLHSLNQHTSVAVDQLVLEGSFADAEELLREYWAKQTMETIGFARNRMIGTAATLAARLLRPDLFPETAADKMLELAFDSANKECIFSWAGAFAEWHATNEEPMRVRELITRAIAVIGDHVIVQPSSAIEFALYGNAAAGRWARNILAQWAAPASNRIGHAYLALVDAIILVARPPRAAKLARAAAEGFHEAGLPYYEALAFERCGNKKQALEIYRRIGDERDARRLAAEIDPMNSRGRRAAELTAREHEIADLIAEGKSNRVIAEGLLLSQRTVDAHVASIFSKLEVSTRSDVADRVARRR